MQLEKVKEFKKFASEVILKVLMKMSKDYEHYEKLEDFDGMQRVKLEFIPKYEKLYLEFSGEVSENLDNYDDEKLEGLMTIINDIMKVNNISMEYILDEVEKREALKGESGAETVERLFKYQINELEEAMETLLEKANLMLDKEGLLEGELRDAIQEDEQMEVLEKLSIVRKEWGALEKKILKCKNSLDNLKDSLSKKWTFDIYGTVSKDELKKAFKSETKK